MGSFVGALDAKRGRRGSFTLACDGADDQPRGQPGNAGQFASAAGAGSGKAKSLKGKAKAEPGAPKGATGRAIKAVEEFVKGKLSPADFAELQRIMSEAGKSQKKPPKDRTLTERATKLNDELEKSLNSSSRDKFTPVFERVKELPTDELLNFANKFTGSKPRTRKEALKKIEYRQISLEQWYAKMKATGGRSAA